MSAYPLRMLVGVCKLREDSAASASRLAEYRLQEEQDLGRKLENDLAEYVKWRFSEEDRRYDGIIGTEMLLATVEDFRTDLAGLKLREAEYEKEIIESGRRAAEREKELAAAKAVYMAALQETRKIEAHREIWTEEWNREQARLEDVEMEEFSKAIRHEGDEEEVEADEE